jgi:hypothetical protein
VTFVEGTPSKLTLTVTDLVITDDGNYECRSQEDYFDWDSVEILIQEGAGRSTIEIIEPEDSSIEVGVGELLDMKCRGGRSSQLEWRHNGFVLSQSTPGGRIIITDSFDFITNKK